MSRIVYVNGAYVPEEEAKVSIFDRAFLFGDGVYEVTAVLGGKFVDFPPHLKRLRRSLGELEMASPLDDAGIEDMHRELMTRNSITDGLIYMQVTRGSAERDFPFPKDIKPTLIAFTQEKDVANSPYAETGVPVVTIPDIRWQRRDIKSTALLAQCIGKEAAKKQGAYEAWMVEDGFVTEGTSSSSFIVTGDNVIITRPLSNAILPGVTRRSILRLAETTDVTVEERNFTVDEAKQASEAFLTSASSFVLPIVEIDGVEIGDGKPGLVATQLRKIYIEEARKGS